MAKSKKGKSPEEQEMKEIKKRQAERDKKRQLRLKKKKKKLKKETKKINKIIKNKHKGEITNEDILDFIRQLKSLFEDIIQISSDYEAKDIRSILNAIDSVKAEPVK